MFDEEKALLALEIFGFFKKKPDLTEDQQRFLNELEKIFEELSDLLTRGTVDLEQIVYTHRGKHKKIYWAKAHVTDLVKASDSIFKIVLDVFSDPAIYVQDAKKDEIIKNIKKIGNVNVPAQQIYEVGQKIYRKIKDELVPRVDPEKFDDIINAVRNEINSLKKALGHSIRDEEETEKEVEVQIKKKIPEPEKTEAEIDIELPIDLKKIFK